MGDDIRLKFRKIGLGKAADRTNNLTARQ